jgi:hypothetical protein
MEKDLRIRWGWLKGMYLYTLITAGGTGFAMLVIPGAIQTAFRFPAQDPVIFKLYACVLLAAGLIAIPALLFPLKFVSLLLLQLVYKPIWLALVAVPLFLKGQFPLHVVLFVAVFLTYIVGDLIAIPFRHLFAKEPRSSR